MASKADVSAHLRSRYDALHSLFGEWETDLGPDERADLVQGYFKDALLGESQRVGAGNSVYISPTTSGSGRANILVIGRHDVDALASSPANSVADASLQGPGLASRLAPTVAFGEGVQAAHALTGDDQVHVNFLSLGDGDHIGGLHAILPDVTPDAVYLTNSATWSPHHPTITTGCRGQLTVQLALNGGQGFDDYLGSGALRNPLSKLAQIIGTLRDDRGRITLPGFYDRAHAPDDRMRTALSADDHDPSAWTDHFGTARFEGRLSSLERAALWPGVSLLNIDVDTADVSRSPGTVVATLGVYLVPDQRHSEVESALRSWFLSSAPQDLHPSFKVLSSTRPFRASHNSAPVAAQARAAYRVHGRQPVMVPAGGPAGSGEVAFVVGAPVAFAGVVAPSSSFGTTQESLPWSDFTAAVELAAETCLQLRRS